MWTIKSRREFESVFSAGRRENGRLVRMAYVTLDEGDHGRVAFVAAKRLGNAVCRNRCKRVLREASRMVGLPEPGIDIILFSTRGTISAHPAEVSRELAGLLDRVHTRNLG